MKSASAKILLPVVFVIVAGAIFQGLRIPLAKEFRSFQGLSLLPSESCKQLDNSSYFPQMRRIETVYNKANREASCETSYITTDGNYASLEIAAREPTTPAEQLKIEVLDQAGRTLKTFTKDDFLSIRKWQRVYFQFDPETTKQIKLIITNNSPHWLTIRNRVSFFEADLRTMRIEEFFSDPFVRNLSFSIFALALTLFSFIALPSLAHNPARFCVFLVLTAFVNFRVGLFFNIDDWDILWNIREGSGLSRYFTPHLEHHIPLFKALLHLQYKLYGGNYYLYLVTSGLIHAANALLLFHLIKKLLDFLQLPERASLQSCNLIALLYVTSALHTEVLTWMICQSTLLAVTAILCSAIFSINYVETLRKSSLIFAALSSLAAPLLFGGGFLLLPFVAGIILPAVLYSDSSKNAKQKIRLYFISSAAISLPILLTVVSYAVFSRSAVSAHLSAINPTKLFDFVSVGTLIGVFGRVFSMTSYFSTKTLPIDFTLGQAVLALLLVLAWRERKRSAVIPLLTIASLLFIIATYLMIGLSRTEDYGVLHALALRYTAIPLLPLFCAAAPLLAIYITRYQELELKLPKRLISLASFVLLFFFFRTQLQFSQSYVHYQGNGIQYRTYLQEMKEWERSLAARLGHRCTVLVSGATTELHGDFPLLYAGNIIHLHAVYPVFDPYRMLAIVENNSPCG